MTESLAAVMEKMRKHFGQIDETVLVVLKGHLLIEESLDAIISGFVFHPEFVQAANLRFGQKLAIARAMSLDEHKNEMWAIALSVNSTRRADKRSAIRQRTPQQRTPNQRTPQQRPPQQRKPRPPNATRLNAARPNWTPRSCRPANRADKIHAPPRDGMTNTANPPHVRPTGASPG